MTSRAFCCSLLMMCSFLTSASDAPTPGGKGQYSVPAICLQTANKLIPQLCASLTIHYEFSTLMGEPLAHYGLTWQLDRLTIANGGELNGAEAKTLLGSSVNKIELMVRALAEVRGKDRTFANIIKHDGSDYFVVDVDSGVATTEGKMSWHIADSPDWAKFFLLPRGGECEGEMIGDLNTGVREFVKPDTAKAVMKTGNVQLSHRGVCRKNTWVGELDPVAAAIRRICKPKTDANALPEKPYSWCPDIVAARESLSTLLDEAASQPLIDEKLRELQTDHLAKVTQRCNVEFDRINQCYSSQGCVPKSDKEVGQCLVDLCGLPGSEKICDEPLSCYSTATWERKEQYCQDHPDDKSQGCYDGVFNTLCMGGKTVCNGTYIDNPKFISWQNCKSNSLPRCQASPACTTKCNPKNYSSVTDCVTKTQEQGAPTEADARQLVQKEKQKTKIPRKKDQPTPFLD